MTLNQLRAFLESARRGSFTAAAGVLLVSQASVSELIRRLEEEHGVQLFVRGARHLVLTSAGQELMAYAEQAVTAADSGSRVLRSVRTLEGGVATFGVLRNAEYYLLSGLVQRFTELHPAVRVRMVGLNSADVAAAVAHGGLEAGIVVLPVDGEGLYVEPWARDEVLYVSAKPVPAPAVTVQVLAEARLVLYDAHAGWRDPTRRQLADRAQVAGVRLEPWCEVEHVETALQLVAKGVGDTVASRAVTASPGFPAGLHLAPLDPPLYDGIALIRRESGPLSLATREMARLAHLMVQANPQVVPSSRR